MEKFGAAELMILLIPALILYFVPAILAISRNHNNKVGILLLNIFLGWTFIGWIAAFIWSLSSPARQTVVVNNNYSEADNRGAQAKEKQKQPESKKTEDYIDKLEHLQKLKELFDSGVLSEEEFAAEKSKVLR
jgi:hypothetical protein